jgi:hypothetical protein
LELVPVKRIVLSLFLFLLIYLDRCDGIKSSAFLFRPPEYVLSRAAAAGNKMDGLVFFSFPNDRGGRKKLSSSSFSLSVVL